MRLPRRLSYANVTSTLALCFALAGGAYAAVDRPGPDDVHLPAAKEEQLNAATYSFGGHPRVAAGQQSTRDQNPGAGVVEVRSGDGRTSQLTHYQYGTTLRSTGHLSNVMEFWL